MDHRRSFGTALRTERIRRGLTREIFAAMVDMTPQALEDLEWGRDQISVAMLFHIGMVLETAPAAMLGEPDPQTPRALEAPEASDFLVKLSQTTKH